MDGLIRLTTSFMTYELWVYGMGGKRLGVYWRLLRFLEDDLFAGMLKS